MSWTMEEALAYYRRQGAPADQNALIALLKEIHTECGGVPGDAPRQIAQYYAVRESLVLALIRRIPGVRMKGEGHCLEICAGPNCGRSRALAEFAEKNAPAYVTVRRTGCMHLCGKGPNLRWDGKLCHHGDEALLKQLFDRC